MLSLRADILIVTKILYLREKKLMNHLEQVGMDVSLILVESFITLFTTTCHPDLTDIIIDHFVIDGSVVLIKAMVLIMSYLSQRLLKYDTFSEMLLFFKNELKTRFIEPKKLSSDLMNFYMSKYLIEELREFYTMKERTSYYTSKQVNFTNTVKCKPNWPICYQALEIFKSGPEATKSNLFKCNFVLDNFKFDYFSKKRTSDDQDDDFQHLKNIKSPKKEKMIEEDDLLIDRQQHICPMKNKKYAKMKSDVKKLVEMQISNYNMYKTSAFSKPGTPVPTKHHAKGNTVKALMQKTLDSEHLDQTDDNDSSWSESRRGHSNTETPTKITKRSQNKTQLGDRNIEDMSLMLAR